MTRSITAAILALMTIVSFQSGAAQAQAGPKPWIFSWAPSHWENLDFVPYLETPRHPHGSQWQGSLWQPEHWLAQRDGEGLHLIRDFYHARIITGQYDHKTVPVLEVGPGFYKLGGQDRRRVAETVDMIYAITTQTENGIFMLNDWHTKKTVGIYSRHGLQMQ